MVPDVPPPPMRVQREQAIAAIVYALPELTDDALIIISREVAMAPRRDLLAVIREQHDERSAT